jgi:hypothetical protein
VWSGPAPGPFPVCVTGPQRTSCIALVDHSTSPISSNDSSSDEQAIERTTTHQDVEEAEAHFPVRGPARLSDDSTGGLPIYNDPLLEDGGGRLAPGPASLGEFDMVSSAHLLPPAGSTPYPTIIALGSEHGGSKYDDANIQCSKCLAPIAYCHCDVLVLPPRDTASPTDDIQLLTPIPNTGIDKGKRPIRGYVVNDLTEDSEETKIPTTDAEEDTQTLERVEVHHGGGVGTETNDGGRVQRHSRRADASWTMQHATHHPLSPTPSGFDRNQGHHYIPFRIPTTNRRGITNAKYVHVRMGVNPTVDGCMYKGGVVHSGEVHATAEHDRGDTPDYTHEQLRHFHSGYPHRHEVDDALERIRDKSLIAEVSQFRGSVCLRWMPWTASIKKSESMKRRYTAAGMTTISASAASRRPML